MQHWVEMGEDYGHSLHWGITPPPSETPPPLYCQAPPKICKLSKPPFLGNSPLYIGFS